MSNPSTLTTCVAASMAVITTIVSWKVLRDHSTLGNPMVPFFVGGLAFIGLCRLEDGWIDTVLIGYVALAIVILLLFLWMGFQKVSRTLFNAKLRLQTEDRLRSQSKESGRHLWQTANRSNESNVLKDGTHEDDSIQ